MRETILRKLAQSSKYQCLYVRAKELGNIRFFDNDRDLSRIQILFLQWLQIYYSLYYDLAMKEDYISEDVIKSEFRTDCYLLYKSKEKYSKEKQSKQRDRVEKTEVIFKRK